METFENKQDKRHLLHKFWFARLTHQLQNEVTCPGVKLEAGGLVGGYVLALSISVDKYRKMASG